jgi:hypothetical protein
MSGNPDNASIWGDADVFVAFDPANATTPASIDVDFGLDWELAGLLDGDAGFEENRSRDSNDFFAWGGLLVRTSRRNFKLQRKFTMLEENAVSIGLIWPGSGQGERRVPKVKRIGLGFETTDESSGKRKRVITRRHAEVADVGTIKDSESELTKIEVTVDIYPDADGVLFDVQPDDANLELSSIAITPLTLALANDEIGKLTVIATYSDASTVDVSLFATYTTSDADKATVANGYVTAGSEDGAVNIGASFRGVDAPAPCVVTVA